MTVCLFWMNHALLREPGGVIVPAGSALRAPDFPSEPICRCGRLKRERVSGELRAPQEHPIQSRVESAASAWSLSADATQPPKDWQEPGRLDVSGRASCFCDYQRPRR
jgi:hypothetical protein